VIEATIYGMPAVFGPNYNKNQPGLEMVELGICASVSNIEELDAWFTPIEFDDEKLQKISQQAREYSLKNCGATEIILNKIFND
jgi:3-deoxy-D-manno-octulosonic-acid transferase